MKVFSLLNSAFIPPIPTKLIMTELERVVATRAISTSVISNLYSEISIDHIILELTNLNFQISNIGLFSILIIIIYGQYKYNMGQNHDKLENIPIYNRYQRIMREVLFIIFIVFTRDVNNAI